MKRSEQLVPRDLERAVVTLKITVVHLMMKGPKLEPVLIFDNQPFKARMRRRSGKGVVLKVIENVHGMGGNNPMYQDRSQENNMLNRVHRQA